MAEDQKTLEFVPERRSPEGDWVPVNEFIWRVPPEELAVAYAAHTIRRRCMVEAEANLKGYVHKEPMRLGGKIRTVKIMTAGVTLKKPFLSGMRGEPGSKEALEELKIAIPKNAEWRMPQDVALQAIASVGWLGAMTKARPPEISKDTSAVDYEESLLPQNLELAEDAAPTGYTKEQVGFLREAQNTAASALEKSGSLGERIKTMPVTTFGELLFRTQSRLFGALPDPETQEREQFEQMRAAAAELASQNE